MVLFLNFHVRWRVTCVQERITFKPAAAAEI